MCGARVATCASLRSSRWSTMMYCAVPMAATAEGAGAAELAGGAVLAAAAEAAANAAGGRVLTRHDRCCRGARETAAAFCLKGVFCCCCAAPGLIRWCTKAVEASVNSKGHISCR